MDPLCTPYGPHMDPLLTSYGSSMDPLLDTLCYPLYGPPGCLEILYTVSPNFRPDTAALADAADAADSDPKGKKSKKADSKPG